MGRTGRRAGTIRNCLFLATTDAGLAQAAALIDLWRDGYVEPIEPPAEPFHVLAQQLITLILQEQGIGRTAWRDWVGRMPGFAAMAPEDVERTIGWMLQQQILWQDDGILGIGERGEQEYGWRNYMEVMSVFLTPPLVRVLHGRRELGLVDRMSFMPRARGPPTVLSLGGRAWLVRDIDWACGVAYVEPAVDAGRSRWKGMGPGLGFTMCRRIRDLLATDVERQCWSRRARDGMAAIRAEYPWLPAEGTVIVAEPGGELAWWTFAGKGVNATLATALQARIEARVGHDNFAVKIEAAATPGDLEALITDVRSQPAADLRPAIDPDAVAALKFADCIPPELAERMLQERVRDAGGTAAVLADPIRIAVGR